MLSQKYLLLKAPFSCFIIIHLLLQTCTAQETPHCPPSSCANVPNISYPFRLRNDPQHCGLPEYELTCENNTTLVTYLGHSRKYKYVVRAINHDNYTIRLSDPAVLQNDSCSLPNYSIPTLKVPYGHFYYTMTEVSFIITFMSCPFPVNNSLLLKVDAADCSHASYGFNESGKKHTYIRFGELNGSYIMDMCTIDLVVMNSLPLKEGAEKSVSLSEIHSSLLYGFELYWFDALCYALACKDGSLCIFDGEKAACYSKERSCIVGRILQYPCERVPRWFVDALDFITWKILLGIGECMYPSSLRIILRVIKMIGIEPSNAIMLSQSTLSIPEYGLALRSIIGMACLLWLLIYNLRRRHLSTFDVIEGFLQSNNNLTPIRYSYRDIKKMTRGFREKLGQGGYGSVYKGKLRSGHIVAVKLLSNPKENGQDFINEIASIGRIHHVNVVKFVGFCAGRFNNKRALVFEFMPNGSLEKYIFSQQSPLSWERKYEIAIGVARGIEYLHRGCDIQILHFDIKPHNILLDDNFMPKISDFGLAKLYSTDNNTVTLTAARGTIGYVAPELINRSIGGVSYKADVYSFGMLLMEMLGLNRNIMTNDEESSQYFPDWIYKGFNKGKDIETGDDDIEDNDRDDDGNDGHAKRIKRKMTVVGLWCIQMSPAERPSMSEVVKMLESQNVNLQIPPQPSESTEIASYNDQTWGTESSGSMALLSVYASHDISAGDKCIETR